MVGKIDEDASAGVVSRASLAATVRLLFSHRHAADNVE
jgi:hypothetical protein